MNECTQLMNVVLRSRELNTLVTEVRHLKMRQDALEDQNCNCSTKDLQQMIDDGRAKLNELMRKSVENEQSISKYEGVIDKQKKHIIEMENLMRYKESMTGILKNNRDELVLDRESLLKYSQEIRTVLVEVFPTKRMFIRNFTVLFCSGIKRRQDERANN